LEICEIQNPLRGLKPGQYPPEYLNESEAPNKTGAGVCVPKTSSVFYCVTAARMPPFRFRVAGQNVSVHADPMVIRGNIGQQ
jgi:hypothetical protein